MTADRLRVMPDLLGSDRPDAELLARFVRTRDEAAFAELLGRHGPMVLGVCRRILTHSHDADDAFQAVFLVLARKADTVRPPGMVGAFLHGVAVRTANKARAMAAKRTRREQQAAAARPATAPPPASDPGVRSAIDAELAALPAVYRAVFVACELNGRTRVEAAKDLGWPEGTVAARLRKARELLAARLTKRGVTLAAVTFTAARVPTALAADTLAAVREVLTVGTAAALAPAAHTLSSEVMKTMTRFKQKLLAAGLLVLVAAGSAALIGSTGERPGPRAERKPMPNIPVPKPAETEWQEAKAITFDGGRVTSVAFSPSGKTLAVARDTGKLDFYDPVTRKHITTMDVAGEKGTAVATVTAVAFAPDTHPKHADIFAVTHKNGVKFGTVGLGIFTDDAAKVEGIPRNMVMKDFDPCQVIGLGDGCFVACNGEERVWRGRFVKQDMRAEVPGGKRGEFRLLAAIPGHSAIFVQNGTGEQANDLYYAAEPPSSSPTRLFAGHKSRPMALAASKDGTRAVSADSGGTLIVWEKPDAKSLDYKEKSRFTLGSGGPGWVAMALSPDGKTVAVVRTYGLDWLGGPANRSSEVFELFVFDLANPPAKPKPVWSNDTRSMPGKRTGPVSLAFSPDGKTLLAAFADPFTDDKKLYGDIPQSVGVKVWELVPKK